MAKRKKGPSPLSLIDSEEMTKGKTDKEIQEMVLDIEKYPLFVPHPDAGYFGRLEPNAFCRGWNSKRQKYCRMPSGHRTDHLGQGRCSWHGKGGKLVHGRYSKIVREDLREHLDRIQQEGGDRTDLTQEVDMLRAVTANFLEKFDDAFDALLTWNKLEAVMSAEEGRKARPQPLPDILMIAALAKDAALLADKIHKQQHRDAIPKKDFFRLQEAQSDAVVKRINELVPQYLAESRARNVINKIGDDWDRIKL